MVKNLNSSHDKNVELRLLSLSLSYKANGHTERHSKFDAWKKVAELVCQVCNSYLFIYLNDFHLWFIALISLRNCD